MGNWAGTGAAKTVKSAVVGEDAEVGVVEEVVERGTGGGRVGEVVVYNVVGKSIPIVHRIVRRHATGEDTYVPQLSGPLELFGGEDVQTNLGWVGRKSRY